MQTQDIMFDVDDNDESMFEERDYTSNSFMAMSEDDSCTRLFKATNMDLGRQVFDFHNALSSDMMCTPFNRASHNAPLNSTAVSFGPESGYCTSIFSNDSGSDSAMKRSKSFLPQLEISSVSAQRNDDPFPKAFLLPAFDEMSEIENIQFEDNMPFNSTKDNGVRVLRSGQRRSLDQLVNNAQEDVIRPSQSKQRRSLDHLENKVDELKSRPLRLGQHRGLSQITENLPINTRLPQFGQQRRSLDRSGDNENKPRLPENIPSEVESISRPVRSGVRRSLDSLACNPYNNVTDRRISDTFPKLTTLLRGERQRDGIETNRVSSPSSESHRYSSRRSSLDRKNTSGYSQSSISSYFSASTLSCDSGFGSVRGKRLSDASSTCSTMNLSNVSELSDSAPNSARSVSFCAGPLKSDVCELTFEQNEQLESVLCQVAPFARDRLIGRKMGLNCVDIVEELGVRNITSVLSTILLHVDVEDLTRMSCVSPRWKAVVNEDKKSSQRLAAAKCAAVVVSNVCESIKENDPVRRKVARTTRVIQPKPLSDSTLAHMQVEAATKPTVPQCNAQAIAAERFWKEAKNLKNDECLMKCTKCLHPALKDRGQERAKCTNKLCQYDFCTSCLLSFHGASACASLTYVSSCRKSSRLEGKVGSKESKKNLRRL